MEENRNPFVKRRIDVANDEIRNLKKEIVKLRSEITTLKTHITPMRDEYLKRMADQEAKEKEMVVVESKSWWWG